MPTRIAVSLPALDAATGDLQAGIASIEQQLAALRAELAPMVDTWSGGASDAYRRCQEIWDTAAADLQSSLTQLHTVVAAAHTRYGHAEDTNVSIWAV